jgi:membrane-bound lytic murein transglycosylase MltF
MSCYSNTSANGSTQNVPLTADKKWYANGELTSDLMTLFRQEADKTNPKLDWRWLAALSYVESNWRTNVKNSLGYYGLFQFLDETLNSNLGKDEKRYSIYSPPDQTKVAAKNMANNVKFAKSKFMTDEDSYLYAGMAHNCGVGGAQFLLSMSFPKTVYQMVQTEKNLPAKDFKYSFMAGTAKRKEISEYPYKLKSAYESICSKYTV